MRRPQPLPTSLSRGPFTVEAALESGVSEPRLRRADLVSPYRGTRLLVDFELDLVTRCAAALLAVGGEAAISHATAARLWELPLPRPLEEEVVIDVAVPVPRRATRLAGVRGHRLALDPRDVVTLNGLRVTSAARTWCDLARVLSDEDHLAVGDRILWRQAPLASRETIAAALLAHPPSQGGARMRRVYPELSDRADSRPESRIRWRLLRAGLPRPEVNFVVCDRNGSFVARVDLAFVDFRMALEYEGDQHRTNRDQWRSDLSRVPRLEDELWHTTRMGPSDLTDSRELIARLKRRLRERGWRG